MSIKLTFAFLATVVVTGCTPHDPSASTDASPAIPDALGPFDPVVAAADVSVLYPLPAGSALTGYVTPSDQGAFGVLLPPDLIPAPLDGLDTGRGTYADLRLISLRLDPCSARGDCTPEIRAVYQPLLVVDGVVRAGDAAVHVFYRLPPEELVHALEEILAAKQQYGAGIAYGDVLGVQPILAATGADGGFAVALRGVITGHLGAARIERVTVFQHQFPDEDAWQFAIYEKRGAAFAQISIVHLGGPNQIVTGTSTVTMPGSISATEPSLTSALIAINRGDRPALVDDTMRAGFASAIALQDPRLHNSESDDCLSCHAAEGAHWIGVHAYGLVPTGEFSSARSLAYRRENAALTNLHAFGYLDRDVSVMRRTANESAVAADRLEAMLPH